MHSNNKVIVGGGFDHIFSMMVFAAIRTKVRAHKYTLSDGIECPSCHNTNARLAMPTTDTTMDAQRSFTLIRQGGKLRDQGVTLLYRKYATHFRKFYLYQGLNVADAEDIVQETFVKIVRHCDSYNGDSPLEACASVQKDA